MSMTTERPIKHILVSVYYRGRMHWALIAARKVGKHYRVSEEAFARLTAAAPPHTTMTMG